MRMGSDKSLSQPQRRPAERLFVEHPFDISELLFYNILGGKRSLSAMRWFARLAGSIDEEEPVLTLCIVLGVLWLFVDLLWRARGDGTPDGGSL